MTKEKQPQLWIIAGANGSGKSTLINKCRSFIKDSVEVINPDNIANILEPENTVNHSIAVQLKAGKQAILQQKEHLGNNRTFAIETTFSGNREIELIKQAKKQGYKTNLVYIGLQNPIQNIKRVEIRTNLKGHFVESNEIIRRYDRSMEQLKNNYKLFDRVILIDNSSNKHKMKALIIDNKVRTLATKQPKWILENLPIIQEYINNKNNLLNKNFER